MYCIFVLIYLFLVAIDNEDKDELWTYLMSHNSLILLQRWIRSIATLPTPTQNNQVFPHVLPLIPLDHVPAHTKECLINLLVKHGYYPQCIIEDFPTLLRYFSQNKLLFNNMHPFIYYKRKIPEEERQQHINDFNKNLVSFCEENDLILLLWHFMQYYRYAFLKHLVVLMNITQFNGLGKTKAI